MGVQTFEYSVVKIKECLKVEISQSFALLCIYIALHTVSHNYNTSGSSQTIPGSINSYYYDTCYYWDTDMIFIRPQTKDQHVHMHEYNGIRY